MVKSPPGVPVSKESVCTAGDLGSIPGLGRPPGGGHGSPLQCSCLENPTRLHGATKRWTQPSIHAWNTKATSFNELILAKVKRRGICKLKSEPNFIAYLIIMSVEKV